MALLEVKNIYKSFGGVKAIQNFSIEANAGEIHGIIGPNGAGKTTIFNTISGVYTADQGTVLLDGQDITKLEQYKITRLGMGAHLPEHPPVQRADRTGKRHVCL